MDSKRKVRHVERYIHRCSIGDWFVLYQMSRNMNRRYVEEYVTLRMITHPFYKMDEETNEEGWIRSGLP